MKSVVPVVMAGIIAIYGVVVAVLISQDIKGGTQAVADANARRELIQKGFTHLGAGLSVGLSGLDAGVRGTAQQPKLYVGMILILIFAEVLGLYGLIVALILNTKGSGIECHAKPYNPCCGSGEVYK